MKTSLKHAMVFITFLLIISFSYAQQNNEDLEEYDLQSDKILIEVFEDEPITISDIDYTKLKLDIDANEETDEVNLKINNENLETNIKKEESKKIGNKDIEIKVIEVEKNPWDKREKAILEIKSVPKETQTSSQEPYSGPYEYTIDFEKLGRGATPINLNEEVIIGINYKETTHKVTMSVTNYNPNTEILTFEINGAEYQIPHSEFEDKENWVEVEIGGLPKLHARGRKGKPEDYKYATLQLALKPGFQTGTEQECFMSPIHTLKVRESMNYKPSGPTRSSLEITYEGTQTPYGIMKVNFGKGPILFSSGFSSTRATSFFPVDRGEDWLSFVICTVKNDEGNLQRKAQRTGSKTDLAIIDMSIDLKGPIKIVLQNTGETTINSQEIPIYLIMNEYNEERSINIKEMQPGDIQTIILQNALKDIEFPNVKGTIASTYAPDFVGVVISEEALINGDQLESRLDNNWFEISFLSERSQTETTNIRKEINTNEKTKVLVNKKEQKIVFKENNQEEIWKAKEVNKRNAIIEVGGRNIELKQGRSEIKVLEEKYVSITPLYFGEDEVLAEIDIKERNSEWEDPVVHTIEEINQFKEEASILRSALQESSESENQEPESQESESSSIIYWILGIFVILLIILIILYKRASSKLKIPQTNSP